MAGLISIYQWERNAVGGGWTGTRCIVEIKMKMKTLKLLQVMKWSVEDSEEEAIRSDTGTDSDPD